MQDQPSIRRDVPPEIVALIHEITRPVAVDSISDLCDELRALPKEPCHICGRRDVPDPYCPLRLRRACIFCWIDVVSVVDSDVCDPQRAIPPIPYDLYLQSPHWQRIRLVALERADWRCQACNTPHRLHVHHRTYERLGREAVGDLTVLCEDCHRKVHPPKERV